MADQESEKVETTEVSPEVIPEPSQVDYKQEYEKLQAELKRIEENKQKAQRREGFKDNRIRELEAKIQSGVSREEFNRLRLELATLEEAKSSDQLDYQPKATNSRLEQLKKELDLEQQRLEQQKYYDQIRVKVEDLQNKVIEAGLDSDDPMFDTVQVSILQGRLDTAEKKLEKILTQHKPVSKEVTNLMTEEEKLAKLKKEIEAEIIKKYGLGTQEGGGASAAAQTKYEADEKYAKGEITRTEYERRKKQTK